MRSIRRPATPQAAATTATRRSLLFAATVALLDRQGAVEAGSQRDGRRFAPRAARAQCRARRRRSMRWPLRSSQKAYAERAVDEPQWHRARDAFVTLTSRRMTRRKLRSRRHRSDDLRAAARAADLRTQHDRAATTSVGLLHLRYGTERIPGALRSAARRRRSRTRASNANLPTLDPSIKTLVVTGYEDDPSAKPLDEHDAALLRRFVTNGGTSRRDRREFAGPQDVDAGRRHDAANGPRRRRDRARTQRLHSRRRARERLDRLDLSF